MDYVKHTKGQRNSTYFVMDEGIIMEVSSKLQIEVLVSRQHYGGITTSPN